MLSFAWKWTLAGLLSAAVLTTPAVAADFDGMVSVGGHPLHVAQAGAGSYTVVFEAGFASDLSVWRKVAPEVAKNAVVLVYSRAGYGKSPARPQPLGLEQSVAELADVLRQRKVEGPLILVGHSYGGFLIRYFAATHPQRVAGLVLVDPADEGLESILKHIDPARLRQDQRMLAASIPAKWQGELQTIQALLDAGQLPAMPALPDVPAVLLTSVQARAGSDFFQETPAVIKIKRERHAAFLSQFSSGAHVFTPNSGHGIQMQEPDLVIAAIGQVMTLATQGAARAAKAQAKKKLMGELEHSTAMLGKQQNDAAMDHTAAALRDSALSEAEINALGFDLLTKAKQTALATLVLAYNVRAYAQSDNAADSYGEALLAGARPAEAQRQFARALALGQANGAREQAMAGYRQHLSQAEQALKSP
ncbi:alpha/beta fold hydrolase [Janthinobacterium sp. FW305-129]|uniref:alpha/beta fold hydrolase n=1 Tax=Janthinobacterium sp. FW305-129 TaxID=2775054 RepID=UPI001E35DA2F|nr:alpha/beta fold hydrolase [Janthinobacterium sp. FW305-129]MCC7597249.1 alpha/beta fold hydrolase [Janthinobacterium sp. FW305-129]